MNILMIGFSKTGNTYMFMDYLKEFNPTIDDIRFDIREKADIDISPYDLIILGTNTWGDGKIPPNCKEFVINNAQKYNKDWVVFGTGNSIFVHYCKAVDSVKKILEDCNNNVLETFKYEQRFNLDELDVAQKDTLQRIISLISKK